MKWTAGALAALLLCVCSAVSQTGATVASKKGAYRIAGRVVSALDGHPLPGTTVSLSNVDGRILEASTVAGDEGSFTFEALAAEKYSLAGQVRGFVPASYDQHELFSTAIVTGAGIDTESLVLRLQPAALLGGRVLDEVGEPVRGAQITLYREGYETGRMETTAANTSQTDAFGDYTFPQLAEGTYFISVRATPWYAVYPSPPDPESPVLTGVDPALDVVYPLTFYGDGTKADAATPILLKPGERFHAEIHLSPLRALKIALHGAPGTQNGGFATFQVPVFDSFDQVMAQIQASADGGGEVVGLAPATSQFEITDPAGKTLRFGALDLTQGSIAVDAQAGETDGSLALTVVPETDGEKLPSQMGIVVRGTAPGTDQRQRIDGDGKATFTGLRPDDYRFLAISVDHLWQTVRIEEGDKPLAQTHRRLAAGEAVELKIVVAGSAKAVEGITLRDGKPFAGAMVVLVPVDALENPDLFRRDQSDLDGTFVLRDVAAGRYIVLAIADGWKLEWGKPEVLARFFAKGVAIAIPADQRDAVRLPSRVIVQDR